MKLVYALPANPFSERSWCTITKFMTHNNRDPVLQRELNLSLMHLSCITHGFAFSAIDSTNDVALQYEKRGEASGTVFITSNQTEGRGRFKRTWFMKEGDIAMSIL